jgi:hypothetical protein
MSRKKSITSRRRWLTTALVGASVNAMRALRGSSVSYSITAAMPAPAMLSRSRSAAATEAEIKTAISATV